MGRLDAPPEQLRCPRNQAIVDFDYNPNRSSGTTIGSSTARILPGPVYVTGQVHSQSPIEMPRDEKFAVSRVFIKAAGFGDFAKKKKVKLVRKQLPRQVDRYSPRAGFILDPNDSPGLE
jgi:hypothetical protein